VIIVTVVLAVLAFIGVMSMIVVLLLRRRQARMEREVRALSSHLISHSLMYIFFFFSIAAEDVQRRLASFTEIARRATLKC
jgi:hypothetical protein